MFPYSTGVFPYVIQPYDHYWRSDQVTPAHLMTKNPHCVSKAKVELKSFMRMLWEQHIAWTRMTILSLVFHLPDVNVVTARLLQNATDMGNSLRPLYGDHVAQTYGNLIREHLVLAADLVKAAIAGDQNLVAATEKKWYSNADEISEFLSRINPYLPKEEFRKMFYEHLALTKSEAVSMITKDYETSVQIYDKIEAEALEMADTITDAIAKQFPGIFV
ncbi:MULTISPECIES: acetylglutamate kinase [unclassified Paenibacillus]|uniref:acetylglutamate kinase n=2 Tax=unclassified Paenibacillus TaxID=185978 RepID=UPI003837EE2A